MRDRGLVRRLLVLLVVLAPGLRLVGHAAGDPPLVAAARQDDVVAVHAFLTKHADVTQAAADGSTALLWAVYNADLDMTRALLAAGAPVDLANHYGVTPLLQASRAGDVGMIAVLLKA